MPLRGRLRTDEPPSLISMIVVPPLASRATSAVKNGEPMVSPRKANDAGARGAASTS
jgi:hypothetical protein